MHVRVLVRSGAPGRRSSDRLLPVSHRAGPASGSMEVMVLDGAATAGGTARRERGARYRRGMGEARLPARDDVARGPRVLLCDDAFAFSLLFRRWMDACGVAVVGETDNARDAVAMASDLQPDVIVLDHVLRDVTSDGLAPRLRAAAPGAKLLLISGMPGDKLAVLAAAAGVDGHLSKAATAQAMCEAVRALLPPSRALRSAGPEGGGQRVAEGEQALGLDDEGVGP